LIQASEGKVVNTGQSQKERVGLQPVHRDRQDLDENDPASRSKTPDDAEGIKAKQAANQSIREGLGRCRPDQSPDEQNLCQTAHGAMPSSRAASRLGKHFWISSVRHNVLSFVNYRT
jgi:hypothetical protein